jgi:hypothetical protein
VSRKCSHHPCLDAPQRLFQNLNMLFRNNIKYQKEQDPVHLLHFTNHFLAWCLLPFHGCRKKGGHWATQSVFVDANSVG